MQCANREIERVLEELQMQGGRRKRKAYSTFSDEDCAVIEKYAAENGNASALKKFKASKPGLIESTVRSFKQKYASLFYKKRGQPMIQHQSQQLHRRSVEGL